MDYVIIKEHDHGFMGHVKKVLCDPPTTWHTMMKDPDGIIAMEHEELKKAKASNDIKSWRENLVHLAAACAYAEKYYESVSDK